MTDLIQLDSYIIKKTIDILLKDKTTKQNIIWATDSYASYGNEYSDKSQMSRVSLMGINKDVIQPRTVKSSEVQSERTKKKAEVFTPAWICNKMNNFCDEEFFGRKEVFNIENADSWLPTYEKVTFPEGKTWKDYVDLRRFEITCGEAPYLVSRYDAATGNVLSIPYRIGLLDRKLRVVTENAESEEEWLKWAVRAYQSIYGYEYQGDNILIARINLMLSFADYYSYRWLKEPGDKEIKTVANIISWNIWQMDGLKNIVPMGVLKDPFKQLSFFELAAESESKEEEKEVECKIYDWRRDNSLLFKDIRKEGRKMKFDFVIGNPPYQQDSNGANANDTPIYHYFYDSAFEIADKVELIAPARFLFNAGGTPKAWNEKMLNDEHFKVLHFEQNSNVIFSNTDIKGGVAITYHDKTNTFDPIVVYTAFSELNSIKAKVESVSHESLCKIITNRGIYRYSDKAYHEQPDEMQKTADRRIAPSCFERMPLLFTENKPNDNNEYIQIYGNLNNDRVYRWIRKDYVATVDNLYKYKVMVPKANGSGAIGEVLSTPLIGTPLIGFTETYISIGSTDSVKEAEAILKYIKSKFARTMLGILKVTQNNAKPTWYSFPSKTSPIIPTSTGANRLPR